MNLHRGVDASPIIPGLWQGGLPPLGSLLSLAGFSTVVLCALEFQPPTVFPSELVGFLKPLLQSLGGVPFAGVEVIYAPNDDSFRRPPTPDQLTLAVKASRIVAARVQEGKQVLVTCAQGVNRSGMVSALAVHRLLGVSGAQAVEIVRRGRAPTRALTNPHFVTMLSNIRPLNSQKVLAPVY